MTDLTKRGLPRKRVAPGASVAERLALHTALDDNGCLIWLGARNRSGYGQMSIDRKLHYVHRVSYEHATGNPIPDGMQIDHLCRQPSCCNPDHLEAVTPQVNVRRGMAPGAIALRRDACLHGHDYQEFGAIVKDRRICRICKIVYARLWRQVPYAEQMRRKWSGETVVDLAAYYALPTSAAEVAEIASVLRQAAAPTTPLPAPVAS